MSNKGFSISDTLKIVETLNGIIRLRLVNEQEILSGGKLTNDFYKLFLFTIDEISFHTDLDNKICSSFLKAFSSEDEIEKYNKLDDLNTRKAYPFLKFSDNQYFLPSLHMLLEAMYETPYHWMIKDDNYKGEFGNNRGAFAENFCEKTIKKVFGHENVYKNVEIYKGKNRLGEIDVLVAYGEIAIVIEIKSKGLSQEARQGDIDAIKKDFNLAVQKAYEQTVKCGLGILDMSSHKIKMNKKVLNLENKFKKIIPICLISENFPSLSYQVKDFLKQNFNKEIGRAYVIDIFFLDILCEYLDSPIMFLNFIGRRLRYWENLSIADECIALGYHLSNNLYFKDEGAFYALGGDSAIDLGVDFIKRRENLNYDLIDFKLLGLHTSGTLGEIVKQKNINLKLEHLELFDSLLIASEDSWHGINKAIQEIYSRYDADRRFHSAALQVQIHKFGFTFCIDNNESNTVFEKLKKIVQLRKYITKSDKWFGVILSRSSPYIKAVHVFDYKWKFDSHLDMLKTMMLPKVGRNDLCYCGSNKKFKKCCI